MERRVRRRLHENNPNSILKRQQSDPTDQAGQISTLGNGTRINLVVGYATELTYSVPIQIQGDTFNVQVDTGSGDLWLANKDCKSSVCNPNSGASVPKWDGQPSTSTNKDFRIDYLIGSASGSIVTTDITIGRTVNQNQALGSVNQVDNEALSTGNFSGILGLSLPSNSIIANQSYTSPPDNSNLNPENGQNNPSLTGSILAGLWNSNQGISNLGSRYFGLGLQRLPSDGGIGNSVITFGAQDPNYVKDESKIRYQAVVPGSDGVQRHWNAFISDIIVGFNGTSTHLSPGTSSIVSNSLTPVAVLDSGAGLNYGPANVLNAVYGAFGIGPAADGSGGYYMPCDLQMNITLGVGGVLVPIHPLDASLVTYNSADGSKTCLGSFQAIKQPPNGQALPADWVLSAPFLRNVWTVFSCDSIIGSNPLANASTACNPTIGLYPTTTNSTLAADQFHRVRVLGEQLGDNNQVNNRYSSNGGLSAGVKAAIGLVCGLVGIIAIMSFAFWLLKRKRMKVLSKINGNGTRGLDDKDFNGGLNSRNEEAPLTDGMTPREEEFSENQIEKTRQLNLIHGIFDDDIHDSGKNLSNRHLSTNSGIAFGTETGLTSHNDWEINSNSNPTPDPYREARKVKKDYIRRHPSLEKVRNHQGSQNQQGLVEGNENGIENENEGNDFMEVGQEEGDTPLRNLTRDSHQNPTAL